MAAPAVGAAAPSVTDIVNDRLTGVANENWSQVAKPVFQDSLVQQIYREEIMAEANSRSRVMILELSSYLEKYLWPHFQADTASQPHVLSLVMMINEKGREGVPMWTAFQEDAERFTAFFGRVASLRHADLTFKERAARVLFFTNCFQSSENTMVRACAAKLVSLRVWKHLSTGCRALQLRQYPQLVKYWTHIEAEADEDDTPDAPPAPAAKKAAKGGRHSKAAAPAPVAYKPLSDSQLAGVLPGLVRDFFSVLDTLDSDSDSIVATTVLYCARVLELMTDLLTQLPTRRFFRIYLKDAHFGVRVGMSRLVSRPEGANVRKQLDVFRHFLDFEVDEHTGKALNGEEVQARHYAKCQVLQRVLFNMYGEHVEDFAFASIASLASRESLQKHFAVFSEEQLLDICKRLALVDSVAEPLVPYSGAFLTELLVSEYEPRISQLASINAMALMPTEAVLWDEELVPASRHQSDRVLALPKLDLQFLTLHDYLLRCFNLFRLESAFEIREDLADTIARLQPVASEVYGDTRVRFQGYARMGTPISSASVTAVAPPRLGSDVPAQVTATIKVSLAGFNGPALEEWNALREHDVLFLVTLVPRPAGSTSTQASSVDIGSFCREFGVKTVRGCAVQQVTDGGGNVISQSWGGGPTAVPAGPTRILQVSLDPAQYQADTTQEGGAALYESFNLLVRRKPKENNFRPVLESIRDMMNSPHVTHSLPKWLLPVLLGYGDATSAHYSQLPSHAAEIDMRDSFVSAEHALASFPGCEVVFENADGESVDPKDTIPPYRVRFEKVDASESKTPARGGKRGAAAKSAAAAAAGAVTERVVIVPYRHIKRHPYAPDVLALNKVPFTPKQIEAIRGGMHHGLSMVVGPPGTGKTDVAVQIITNLYHAHPKERILLITHSNQALNDLFAKIMERDVAERHLVRLGQGERELAIETDRSFSRQGRVDYAMQRREALLAQVQHLARSLNIPGDVGYTCETAGHFYLFHIVSRIEAFQAAMDNSASQEPAVISSLFPFGAFFSTMPGGLEALFKRQSYVDDLRAAQACIAYLEDVFEELKGYRAYELLRSNRQKADYLVTSESRIVAMTCTHAAMNREKLVSLGFKYDTLVMEEAAQILEIETFIPLVLQNVAVSESCRLKRIVLIGDHHQLPPVIKNAALQQYAHLDQSMFARFVRLGVPLVELDAQGRARPDLAALYNWRYQRLTDLPNVTAGDYKLANAGFQFTHQFIDVQDYDGQGERQPAPHAFENLAEAEYVAAAFQYMRLSGYPAERISVLTTYQGQKKLLKDVFSSRCAPFPFFGMPNKITTVDEFQGQQNDYILLSLVRSKNVGHLRDVRRLVVAMSRARLGLYVFGRAGLFSNCYELMPTMQQWLAKPTKLQLVIPEKWPATRAAGETSATPYAIEHFTHMSVLVHKMAQAAAAGASTTA